MRPWCEDHHQDKEGVQLLQIVLKSRKGLQRLSRIANTSNPNLKDKQGIWINVVHVCVCSQKPRDYG